MLKFEIYYRGVPTGKYFYLIAMEDNEGFYLSDLMRIIKKYNFESPDDIYLKRIEKF